MPFEEPSTTCVISHVIVLLIAILKGSSDQHRAALQQKLRVGPGKQLIPKAEISAVLEFHALHEEKKKKKERSRTTSKIPESHRTNSPSPHPLCYYGTGRNLWIINTKVPLTRQLSRSSASISHPPPRLFASSASPRTAKTRFASGSCKPGLCCS